METPQASGLPSLPLHGCVFPASRTLSHVSPFLLLPSPCAPFLTQRGTASGPSPPFSGEGTAPPGLAPARCSVLRAEGREPDSGRRWGRAAGAGRLCRSELRVADSSAAAGWEAGILTHCGSGGAAGWRAVCSCASPAPFSPCNLFQGRGAPARHPLGQGPPAGFPNRRCSWPWEPSGRCVVTVCLFPHLPPGDSFRAELSNPPLLMKSEALALGTLPGTSS